MAHAYAAIWGNDEINDGLTEDAPKRLVDSAFLLISNSQNVYVMSDIIDEYINHTTNVSAGLVCTRKTRVMHQSAPYGVFIQWGRFYNLVISNFTYGIAASNTIERLDGCIIYDCTTIANYPIQKTNGNIFYTSNYVGLTRTHGTHNHQANTIHNIARVLITGDGDEPADITRHKNHIISNSGVDIAVGVEVQAVSYSLFIDCTFKIGAEATYTAPAGATEMEKINDIRTRCANEFGGAATSYLIGCQYYSGSYNDIFLDADNGNFHLVPNSIAAHMSFYGDYIGASLEGVQTTYATDFTNINNIDTLGNVTDQNTDADVDSVISDIGHIRKITDIQILGVRAKRNGQSVNNESDLGANIAAGSGVLTAGGVYQATDDVVIIDNVAVDTLNPFDCYVAVDEGGGAGLGFSGSGTMRQVLIDKYPEKMQFKFSQDDVTLVTANTITCYLHRDADYVMVNVDGTGKPLYGDADVSYNEGTAVILSARYWQSFPLIKAWNLAAR